MEQPKQTKTAVQTGVLHRATHARPPLPAGQPEKASWGRRALAEKWGWREDWGELPRKMLSEEAKPPSQNMFWEDAVLFSVVKIPRCVKKIYISILKKESSQAF